jgi:hypothetical protein
MTQVHLLFANRTYDIAKPAVEKNQIICMEGYDYDRYVVYDIRQTRLGLSYGLINLRTHEFGQCNSIRPLSQKFGIGYYFDENAPEHMDDSEVAALCDEAEQATRREIEETQKEQKRNEELKTIGRQRLEAIFPASAKAVITAELRENESDTMRDYYGYNVRRTVILGFSTHTKNLFPEMRKHAASFEETAHLAEYKEEYEHREKYTGGDGYYLGKNKYRGWTVQKGDFGNRKQFIERYALTASDEANICIKTQPETGNVTEAVPGDFIIVDYSEKAIAVFGDTKPVKEQLKMLGGRFNPGLTHEGEKRAGWIFSRSKTNELKNLLTVK